VKGISWRNIEKCEFLKGNVIKWKDIRVNKNEFIREFGDLRWRFVNGEILNKEISYKLPSLISELKELEYDDKIGVIDFETFGSKLNGFGDHNAYAGGWCRKGKLEMLYINENEGSEEFVVRVIENLFDDKENSNMTFYAHNLGRFDSLLLLKGILGKNGYTVKGMWKDNTIISLVIKNDRTKMKIKLLDSLHLLKDNLRNILKSFECDVLKGIFPYRFMTKDKLFYLGRKPDLNYYDGIDLIEYNKIDNENWSAKDETLKYLRSDLNGLLEVILKFSKTYYDKYQVNVTKYRTLPGLTFAMFTSNFYDEENSIKMVKGSLEKDIRSSYFGGNVNVFIHEIIGEAFYYDMNSQYPFAMLNDMPVGEPILSNEKNINNFFGFAYGEIIPPSESRLKNLYIQKRNDNGSVSCPRESFKRLIFSEEIKYAISEGYQFNMEWGYKFKRGKGIFDEFVKEMYKDKKESSNPIVRKIAKYSLNSLYGKFGQKDISNNIKIVKRDELKSFTKNYNYQYISEIDNKFAIIKYSSRINEKLRKMYKEELSDKVSMIDGIYKSKQFFNQKGVPSSVHIASAIAAYARISINKFKNIPGNTCYYSDTDSVILEKRLDNYLIGKELGQMKLEHHIKRGIIIRNKLYALETYDNDIYENGIVIKSSGVDSRKLKYSDFEELLKGNSIEIKSKAFMVGWKDLRLNISERKIKLKGLDLKDKKDEKGMLNSGEIENDKILINTPTIPESINEEKKLSEHDNVKVNMRKVSNKKKDYIKGIGKRRFSSSVRILSKMDNDDEFNKEMNNRNKEKNNTVKSESNREEIRKDLNDKERNAKLIYDGSKEEEILGRKNGIYKIYNNIF
jgi:hypothetical protein